ncbi:hypothetical protein QQ045_000701 [Rhodiola kirilowii]
MDDKASTPSDEAKMTRKLAIEGQKHLEETVDSAYQILSSMNEELCNSALWSITPTSAQNPGDASSESSSSHHDFSSNGGASSHASGGGALDEARLRYKASVAALRAVLVALPSSQKEKADEMSIDSPVEQSDIDALENQAYSLRQEIADKNKYIKRLIDQLRELVNDIATWQSPCPV